MQFFTLFVFVFEYFTPFEYIWIVSVFTNSIHIRIHFKLQNEYYLVFIFVPKSLFVPTLVKINIKYLCIIIFTGPDTCRWRGTENKHQLSFFWIGWWLLMSSRLGGINLWQLQVQTLWTNNKTLEHHHKHKISYH